MISIRSVRQCCPSTPGYRVDEGGVRKLGVRDGGHGVLAALDSARSSDGRRRLLDVAASTAGRPGGRQHPVEDGPELTATDAVDDEVN